MADMICTWIGVFAIAFGIAKRIDRLAERQGKTEDDIRRLNEVIGLIAKEPKE